MDQISLKTLTCDTIKVKLTIGWIGGVLPAFVIPDTVPIRPVHIIRAESTSTFQ